MIKRLIAIGFIFGCTSIAWFVLAGITSSRTDSADRGLRQQVERVWGAPQLQPPPSVSWTERVTRKVESVENDKKVVRTVEHLVPRPIPVQASDIDVSLKLDHRQKGLLWYSTYAVDFSATYVVENVTGAPREVDIALPFPSKSAVFDDLRFEAVEKPWLATPVPGQDRIAGRLALAPGERVTLRVGYRSQGLDRWTYSFGAGIAEVRNFRLNVRTNFAAIDFPDGSISPVSKERAGAGWRLGWEFRRLVSGVTIAIVMPEMLQPGPLASQIAAFAPVSLFFFIVVLLTIGVVTGVELHPMHFFFLAAAFFAFHLLFAYLADQVAIHAAFAISATTSLALVVSYLRAVVGSRFAFFAAGAAQLVYLVLFSYAFFFKGLTGLAITIGAIVTLFVLMQATARIQWSEIFAARAAAGAR
ncbi:MAG: inner membrane CreD family protein [Betaproteobacteria bacterium]|nr:inner membrane CreD family protein [Betaproteobacteria bacterium]